MQLPGMIAQIIIHFIYYIIVPHDIKVWISVEYLTYVATFIDQCNVHIYCNYSNRT